MFLVLVFPALLFPVPNSLSSCSPTSCYLFADSFYSCSLLSSFHYPVSCPHVKYTILLFHVLLFSGFLLSCSVSFCSLSSCYLSSSSLSCCSVSCSLYSPVVLTLSSSYLFFHGPFIILFLLLVLLFSSPLSLCSLSTCSLSSCSLSPFILFPVLLLPVPLHVFQFSASCSLSSCSPVFLFPGLVVTVLLFPVLQFPDLLLPVLQSYYSLSLCSLFSCHCLLALLFPFLLLGDYFTL